MDKKQIVISKINKKEENWYRTVAKEYLERYTELDTFEITVFSEIIYEMITKHQTLKVCFESISKEYNINCKLIVFLAIMPMKMYQKLFYILNTQIVTNHFFNIIKEGVIRESFNGKYRLQN